MRKRRTGRNKSNDNHQYKRTLSLDKRSRLLKWKNLKINMTNRNSIPRLFVRNCIFGNSTDLIELKIEDDITYKLFSTKQKLELKRQGNNR